MVCVDEMDPDKAVVTITFEGGATAYSDDLNNVALSHDYGLVATSRYALESLTPRRFNVPDIGMEARARRYVGKNTHPSPSPPPVV